MPRMHGPRLSVLVGALLALAVYGCRPEPASIEELFTTRSMGLNYLNRGQLPEAETQFKKLIELAPSDPLGYANLGLTYLRAARYSDAEAKLLRARELDPANLEIGLMLAKLYSLTGRRAEAHSALDKLRRDEPRNARLLYALAELEAQDRDSAAVRRYEERLREALAVAPANLAVRLKLLDVLARQGAADSAVRHLEEIRRIPPEPPSEAKRYLDTSLQLLRAGKLAEARTPLDHFLHMMELTAPYQASLDEVKTIEGPIAGRPVLTFAPADLITLRGVRRTATANAVQFMDATVDAGLPNASSSESARGPQALPLRESAALAMGDFNGDGTDDLFVSVWSPNRRTAVAHLYAAHGGQFLDVTARAAVSLHGSATSATFADFDNDGWLDLFVIGADGGGVRGHLFRNRGNGTFEDVTAKARVGEVGGARKALFVDLDHDGDLDLLLVGNGKRIVYRNNSDGSFTDVAATVGLAGSDDARDIAFGDFDGDGRIDVFIANASASDALLHNGGVRGFSDATSASGLTPGGGSGAVAVGDYNNDGFLDIFVARVNGGEHALWLNKGDGTFTRDSRSAGVLQRLSSVAGMAAEFVDCDNDGWLDLVVAGEPTVHGSTGPGVFLLHNDRRGKFEDRSNLLPAAVRSVRSGAVAVADIDDDGDEDLLVADADGNVRLLRNDGGNENLAVRVELKGLRTGSGKNNDFGIGARLEIRAGEILQTRVVTSRVTHFGLGPHLKADIVRVEWTNGVPETVYFPGTDADVLERELLKGSCPFIYTWDGHGFRFLTDVMWRSALGMPLGMMGSTSAFAPAGASQEYLRIPGTALQPRDGRYVLQFTEELWETAYADEIRLLAVDHPDSVDVFVDERFVPPGPVDLRLYQVVRPQAPVSAVDDGGNDVLPALRHRDDLYVSNLTPVQYQGLVEPHDLTLDLGADAGRAGTFLFLRGWIYPTDASINVALSQQSTLKSMAPSLEVRDAQGRWKTAVPSIGFPSGKDKTIVVDLAGIFPTTDHSVRIRTNMQIYWGQAFVSANTAKSPVRVTPLALVSADLHYRGFSRMYRRGDRYGPHWFAYDDVSTAPQWRPIGGTFTRFGDVLPLLKSADDMYTITAPGDEITLEFDAASASVVPPGWRRDFLLYTDGWVKDSDLNTAFGNTVGPLPFHRMKEYPYAPGDSYPTDPEHQRYLRAYNTRISQRR
jgi:tetratricopeptide (TPR) repeat protein